MELFRKIIASCCTCLLMSQSTISMAASALSVNSQKVSFWNKMTSFQQKVISEMAVDRGFSSAIEYIDSILINNRVSVDPNRIKDVNLDGYFDVSDVIYLHRVLNGMNVYQYDYVDLDVDGDNIISKADPDAYIYALAYMTHIIGTPGPNYQPTAISNPTNYSATESVSYVKHNVSNGIYPHSNDVYYQLNGDGTSNTISTPFTIDMLNNLQSTYDDEYWEELESNSRSISFTRVQDTRVVKCSGSGVIVGQHTILTNAHCVYKTQNQTYQTETVKAYTFAADGTPTEHILHTVSYHVPCDYMSTGSNTKDYALIVVSEDLSSYGYMDLGLPLDSIAQQNRAATLTGFPQDYLYGGQCQPTSGSREYTVASYGILTNISKYRLDSTCNSLSGASGSPISVVAAFNGNSYDTVASLNSCHNNNIDYYAQGVRIVRNILQLCYNNPYL